VQMVEGNTTRARQRERPGDPAWSETLACADAPCAGTGRSRDRPFGNRRRSAGRRGAIADDARSREVRLCHSSCEAGEQGRATGSESVERRAGAKGKAARRSTRRAQDRESVSQALDRIRKSQRKGRRRSLLRSSTISVSICASRRFSNSRTTPRPVWMG
jgi:hypothetical protein